MLTCTNCGASRGLHTVTVYTINDGRRRRLRTCKHCGERLRTLQVPGEPEQLAQELLEPKARRYSTKLTAEQALAIRVAAANGQQLRKLGARYGISHQAVSQLVAGETWRHVGGPIRKPRPPAPPVDGPTCESCADWCNGCSFSFPEAGGPFAAECSLYEPRSQYTSRSCAA
jgi:hypothetical protein